MDTTSDIKVAVDALRAGKIAVFPTDTVWGVGLAVSSAPDPQAVFDAKRRAQDKPLAWLVGGPDALEVYGKDVGDEVRNLAAAFWPGALTLVVKASDAVPPAFASKQGTVGLRMPAHGTALELVRQAGPLAASSANLSGDPSPVCAADIAEAVAQAAACVLDDGSTPSGRASTVVDCTGSVLRVLRQGDVVI